MPTVKDKPPAPSDHAAKTLDRALAPSRPVTTEPPRRPERYTRWIGWFFVLAIAIAAASITTVVVLRGEPDAEFGATLEQRLAKDAIEAHQQEVLSAESATPPAAVPVLQLDQLLRKDAIDELNADRSGAYAAPAIVAAALRLDQLLRKDAIDELNAGRYLVPSGSGLAGALEMRLLKETIEDSQHR